VFRVKGNGDVGIGSETTNANLTVKGVIFANELKLQDINMIVIPDYVFEKNYKLRSLKEVEEFVNENKHLPEVPSAKQISENGMGMVEMNIVLLKKVEELTLYLIEQNKKIEFQQKEIELLNEKVR